MPGINNYFSLTLLVNKQIPFEVFKSNYFFHFRINVFLNNPFIRFTYCNRVISPCFPEGIRI
jgi:hypothetical protein